MINNNEFNCRIHMLSLYNFAIAIYHVMQLNNKNNKQVKKNTAATVKKVQVKLKIFSLSGFSCDDCEKN